MQDRPFGTILVLLVAAATLVGCVEKEKRLSKADRELARQIVLQDKPKPEHELDVRFENKIRLLGYDLPDPNIVEGKPFKIVWYWQVNESLGEGWKIFTHLADATKTSRINLDAARVLRRAYPVTDWKAGDLLQDVQEVTIPDDWNSPEAIFYIGFWNGPHRLHVTKGPSDDDNRAEVLKLPVAEADFNDQQAPPEVRRITARRLTGKIELDGKLDESDWTQTQRSEAFVNTMSGTTGVVPATVRIVYDADKLYLGYEVTDELLKSTHKKNDDHLWEQDTVELMVDPDGDGKNYFEIQVAPNELVFDTRYDSRRRPLPFGHVDWDSKAIGKVALKGALNDDTPDEGYSIEMAVPWSSFAVGDTPATAPNDGDTWRMNFFVMDLGEHGQRAVGWSPPMVGDFHVPERFGRVVFLAGKGAATEQGQATAPPAAAASKPGEVAQ